MLNNIFKSLTIAERYELLAPLNLKEAPQSINHWRSDMSIISDKTFEHMLYINLYNQDTFSHAVQYAPEAENIEKYRNKAMQSQWFIVYRQAMALMEDSSFHEDRKNDLHDSLRPFMRYSRKIIHDFLVTHEHIHLEIEVVNQILIQLEQTLMDMAHKSLVLELNLCRENGRLEGDTSEERFLSFVRKFDEKNFVDEFYNKYIVLTRLLSTATMFFTRNIQTLLSRIFENQQELTTTFDITDFTIQSITLGEGDTHQQGNTVSVITFCRQQ